jgi:relaxase-like protein/conjugative element/phage-associated large polyvalent protein/DNA relaxase TraI-like protein
VIGKVITLEKSGPAKGGFREAVKYITRNDPDELDKSQELIASSEMGVVNLNADLDTPGDLQNVWSAMNTTALRSRRLKGNPVYHLAINWMEGEHPDQKQVDHVVGHVMDALGMGECEAVWAMHRDTDNDHVHLIVNRVHPERAIVMGPPRFDYLVIDRAMREIELAQGWRHAPGPYVVIPHEGGVPEIVRLSRAERRARGLMKDSRSPFQHSNDLDVEADDNSNSATSQRAYRAAHNQGAPSFQEWVAGEPARVLAQTMKDPGANWKLVHQTLAVSGLRLELKGSGMVITTMLGGRVLAAKASQLGRWASKGALEKRLGPYELPVEYDVKATDESYAEFLQACHQGREDSEENPTSGDDGRRKVQQELRARARRDLYDRFNQEQRTLTSRRKDERQTLQKRHRQEREGLRLLTRSQRSRYIAVQKASGVHPRIAASLWSFMAAQEREVMQKRHANERKALRLRIPGTQVWREWLIHQADMGDEAARAALRGIRYREQRKRNQHQNGIVGEDLESLRPVLVGLRTKVDTQHLRIHYLSDEGQTLFTDSGSRIDVHDKGDRTLEAALRVAAQKFGGSVEITGSAEFRKGATEVAARLGVRVSNEDLKNAWERAHRRTLTQSHLER